MLAGVVPREITAEQAQRLREYARRAMENQHAVMVLGNVVHQQRLLAEARWRLGRWQARMREHDALQAAVVLEDNVRRYGPLVRAEACRKAAR